MKKSYRNIIYLLLLVIGVGVYYFKDKLFSNETHYYGYFESVSGLDNGSSVLVNGVQVGKVHAIDVKSNKARVTLQMLKNEPLPSGTYIKLTSGSGLLSGKIIVLVVGSGPDKLVNGAVLPTKTDTTIVESISAKVTPLVTSAKLLLKGAESGLTYVNYFIRTGLTAKAVETMIELDSQSKSLSEQAKDFNEKSFTITKGIRSIQESTKGLAGKDASIDSTINNAEKNTNDLAKKDLRKSVADLQANIAKINNSLKNKQAGKPDDMYPKLKAGIDSLKGKMKTMGDDAAKAAREGK